MGNQASSEKKESNQASSSKTKTSNQASSLKKKASVAATTATDNDKEQPLAIPDEFHYEKGSCALEYWEPVKLLAEGSISDIHLVRRRSKRIHVRYKDKRDVMKFAKANVDSVKDINKDKLYVLKSIHKDHVYNERVLDEMRREIDALSHLRHPNIVQLVEAYERRRHIYLVMEYCTGGDLSGRHFSEPQTAVYVQKILSAVAYMHDHGVVHRDLKLENIMLGGKDGREIKIVDFGLATKYLSEEYQEMTDRVGTLYSMAPQVLQGQYTSKCDIWSIGVCTYMLLSDIMPFWGPPRQIPWNKRKKIMIDRIMRCDYMRMKGPKWDKISQQAKDFVASLLQLDPDNRPTAQEALQSPWLQQAGQQQELCAEIDELRVQMLLSFKRNARKLLAEQLTEREIVFLRDEMEKLDTTGDGHIRLSDLETALTRTTTTLSKDDMARLFDDIDETSSIEYTDFIYDVLRGSGRNLAEAIAKALDDLDVDGKRKVSVDQLQSLLDANDVPARLQKEIWKDVYVDNVKNVSIIQVLEVLGKHLHRQLRDSIRSGEDLEADENLLDETATIPGGSPDKKKG